jgi:hypothetical protein
LFSHQHFFGNALDGPRIERERLWFVFGLRRGQRCVLRQRRLTGEAGGCGNAGKADALNKVTTFESIRHLNPPSMTSMPLGFRHVSRRAMSTIPRRCQFADTNTWERFGIPMS